MGHGKYFFVSRRSELHNHISTNRLYGKEILHRTVDNWKVCAYIDTVWRVRRGKGHAVMAIAGHSVGAPTQKQFRVAGIKPGRPSN